MDGGKVLKGMRDWKLQNNIEKMKLLHFKHLNNN